MYAGVAGELWLLRGSATARIVSDEGPVSLSPDFTEVTDEVAGFTLTLPVPVPVQVSVRTGLNTESHLGGGLMFGVQGW
jgi:hypothetical protein